MPHEIPLPPSVADQTEAREMLRVFVSPDGKTRVLLRGGAWNGVFALQGCPPAESDEEHDFREIGGWSLVLNEIIGHVANFMQTQGVPVDQTLKTLFEQMSRDFKECGQNISGQVIVDLLKPQQD